MSTTESLFVLTFAVTLVMGLIQLLFPGKSKAPTRILTSSLTDSVLPDTVLK